MAQDKSNKIRRPIPQRENEKLRANLIAPNITNPNNPSFPTEEVGPSNRQPQKASSTKKPINRGQITRRDDDDVKDVSIGLQDHDEAIKYYFDNIIKPTVVTNGDRVDVPLIYGNPERWKGVQRDGYYRDKEGKIQTPLIMFQRTSVEKRRDLGNKWMQIILSFTMYSRALIIKEISMIIFQYYKVEFHKKNFMQL